MKSAVWLKYASGFLFSCLVGINRCRAYRSNQPLRHCRRDLVGYDDFQSDIGTRSRPLAQIVSHRQSCAIDRHVFLNVA
jgi:hypothetical protein